MRNQLLIGCLMGVAIWMLLAFDVEAPKPKVDYHRPAGVYIKPAVQLIPCTKHGREEHDRTCAARARTEKVQAKNP